MSLVSSLLHSILQVNGEALVLHVGEKPYVVTPSGQIELASKGLTYEAVSAIVGQLLSIESKRALEEFGATQYELAAVPEFPSEHFTVVAARGGDDVWCEIRRRRVPDDDYVPADIFDRPPEDEKASEASIVEFEAAAAQGSRPAPTARPTLRPEPEEETIEPGAPPPAVPPPTPAEPSSAPAQIVPMPPAPIRADAPAPAGSQASEFDRLLRLAAARGASTLYLASQAPPTVRVDGEVRPLDGESPLGPNDVESLLLALMPQRNHETLRAGAATEWMCDVAGVGRVRCMTFRDHRGPGGVFRIMPGRVLTAEQLGLSRQLQVLALEPEGLLLVTGPRLSGKRTLISAFVDLVNRTRRDHVITVESEITVVHTRVNAFISQREARGGPAEMLAVATAALREDPDVLVLESLRAPGLVTVALEAAAAGQLVIGGIPAHSTTSAIDRIINACPPEERRQVQLSMAENLRGAIGQMLIRRIGGGRLAAREVLLNTPAVASAIAEGKTSQLPMAIEGGRRLGMVSLNDALAGLVQSGAVDPRDVYLASPDRAGLLATFTRLGLDTSFAGRRA